MPFTLRQIVVVDAHYGRPTSSLQRQYDHYTRSLENTSTVYFFSPLGKLAGRAIYFTNVFSIFLKFFLMVDFLAIITQTLMEQSSPKFQDW